MPQYFGKLQKTEQPWSTIGSVESINKTDRAFHFNCGETSLNLSILAPNLIRVRMSPTGEFKSRSQSITVPDEEWEITPFEVRETDEKIEIETAQITISVNRDRASIECFDKSGKPFASDCDPSMGWRTGATAGWKRIEADEHFYGFGERTGFLDKLSQVKTHWTIDALDYNSLSDEMYQAIPFYIALNPDRAYGLFFNTTFWSRFDIGAEQPGVLRMETRGPELDYYIIYGPETRPNSCYLHAVNRPDAASAKMGAGIPPMPLELRLRRRCAGVGEGISRSRHSLRCHPPRHRLYARLPHFYLEPEAFPRSCETARRLESSRF